MSHDCCQAPQDPWTGLKTEGTISFSFPCINGLSIGKIIQNWLRNFKLTSLSSFPESLISLSSSFITLDTFGNTFKVPEKIEDGRYTKINITKHCLTANVLKPDLGFCQFGEMLTGTIPFPDNKLSRMTVVYQHNLPTLDMKEIKEFGHNGGSPSSAMAIIAVIGIRDIDENNKTEQPGEYMILNVKDKRPKDICIRKAFKVLNEKKKTINTEIICNFSNKNEKTITFIVNGRKLIPKINKNKNYSLKIRKEHNNVKFVPFIYCKLFMKMHFPQWKYGRAFPQPPPSPDSDDLEEII